MAMLLHLSTALTRKPESLPNARSFSSAKQEGMHKDLFRSCCESGISPVLTCSLVQSVRRTTGILHPRRLQQCCYLWFPSRNFSINHTNSIKLQEKNGTYQIILPKSCACDPLHPQWSYWRKGRDYLVYGSPLRMAGRRRHDLQINREHVTFSRIPGTQDRYFVTRFVFYYWPERGLFHGWCVPEAIWTYPRLVSITQKKRHPSQQFQHYPSSLKFDLY